MPPVLHRVKSCGIAPPFVTLKVTGPALTDLVESVNLNSLGLPAVTVTVVAWAAVGMRAGGQSPGAGEQSEKAERKERLAHTEGAPF